MEFAGHSVTSPGYEGSITVAPSTVAAALVRADPELDWCDTSRRGYMALTITADSVINGWLMVDTVKRRSPAATVCHHAAVARGGPVLV